MSKHPRYWRSDAQSRIDNIYNPWTKSLSKTAPPLSLPDSADIDHDPLLISLHSYADTEMSAVNRTRCATINFTLKGSGKQFLRRLQKGKALMVVHEGHDMLALLAKAAHETPEHMERFQQGFLLGVFLREARVAGVEQKAGPCTVQLLARDCVFNEGIGKIECAPPQRQLPWTNYLAEHTHCSVRDLDAKEEHESTQKITCAVQMMPNAHREFAPGQHPVYATHAGVNNRLIQHLDAGSMGLYNFIEYPDGSPHIRAPLEMVNPKTDERKHQCPDSLVWFACQVLADAYPRKDLVRKLSQPSKGHTRRTELDRYMLSLREGTVFLPRSHLPRFDATKNVKLPTKDEENVDLLPVIPTDVNKAYKLYYKEVVCRTRGIVDFTKGLRVVFRPLDTQAWLTNLKKDEHVSLSVTFDIVYVYLPHWLDTDAATKVATKAQDKADEEEDNKEEEEASTAVNEDDDDDALVMISDDDDDDTIDAAIASTPLAGTTELPPSVAQS